MKLRKLFAGVAAAATLLSGLALGAAASAADGVETVTDNQQITFTAEKEDQLKGKETDALKAYKLGDYVKYTSGNDAKYSIQATDAAKDAIIAQFRANSNLTPAYPKADAADQPADPLQWFSANVAQTNQESALRNLADALKTDSLGTATDLTLTPPALDATVNNLYKSTLTNNNNAGIAAGYYLIVDNSTNPSANIIVGTAQDGIDGTGTVNFKNQTTEITKTVDKTHGSIGEVLTYTITVPVPTSANGFTANADGTPYKFAITDYPSKGLTIDPSTEGNVTLGVLAKDAAKDAKPTGITAGFSATTNADNNNAANNAAIKGTRTPGQPSGEADKRLVVDATQWVKDNAAKTENVGGKLVLTVKATINADVLNNGTGNNVENLDNKATVDNNGAAASTTAPTVRTYNFGFTKVDADGKALTGASFKIGRKADNGTVTYLSYDAVTQAWSDAASKDDATTFGGADSGNQQPNSSAFTFKGLDAGTYVVEETAVPDGFADFKGSFEVTLGGADANAVPQFKGTDAWKLAANNGTAAAAPQGGYTVKNVKTIAQLPLTGAAGIGLFAVVALLLAGAGVTVFAKSRFTKRMLHA